MRRFWLDATPAGRSPSAGDVVLLSAEESHHLFHVLRGGRDEIVALIDGGGRHYRAVLLGQQDQCARLRIAESWEDAEDLQRPWVALASAVVKGRHFEWALEKATEMGAHMIWPLRTERSVVLPGQGRQQRWSSILRTALKQCGRAYLPRLQEATDLQTCLEQLGQGPIYFGDAPRHDAAGLQPQVITAHALLRQDWPSSRPGADQGTPPAPPPQLTWVVGPEGGWTERERQLLTDSGACAVRITGHHLRSETAAVAGLLLLQVLRSRWHAGTSPP